MFILELRLINVLVFPNLDGIVTAARDKPPLLASSGIGADQAAR